MMSGSTSELGGCPFSELGYTAADVAAFRKIPTRTHHAMRLSTFKRTFSGKEAVSFIKKQKACKSAQAKLYGDLMLQGGVFSAVNFRLQKRFTDSQRSVYRFNEEEAQNLFWLTEEAMQLLENERRNSMVHNTPEGEAALAALGDLKEIPSLPVSVPIFGHAILVANPLDMNRSMMNMSRNLCPKYGPIFKINLVGQQYVVVSEPSFLQTIFESGKFGKFVEKDAIFCELKQFRGEGLTTISDGPLHDQCQGIVAPLLMRRVLENYLPTVIETVNMSIMELEKQSVKKAVDMKRFWKKCILRAVGKVAISEDLYSGATKWKQFCKNITFVAEEAIDRVFKGSKLMPLRRYNFAKAVKQLHVTLMGVISDRKALHLQTDKDPKDYDLLDVMLKTPISQSETGADVFMSDELVRANLTTILSAGHSTTTSMLSWACNFLYDFSLGNHDCLNAVLLEVEQISGGDRKYMPTIKDVYDMKYITNVLKETLRLQPPIPTILRMAKETVDVGGHRVPAGSTMMVSILGTHLNSDHWNEPTKFKPERFNELPEAYTFLPWAGGQRQCIGREFAMLTGRVAMFLIHNQLNLNMDPSARVEEIEHLFVFPNGLRMRGMRRRSSVGSLRSLSAASANEPTPPEISNDGAAPVKSRNGLRQWEGLRQLVRKEAYRIIVAMGTKSPQGSTQMVAEQLYGAAIEFHFKCGEGAVTLNDVADEFIATKPTQHTTLAVVLSTYQGNAAPNAKRFYSWVMDLKTKAASGDAEAASYLENVSFFVFGCGNDSWAATYQKVALQLDEALPHLGAKRICVRGEYNEACDDLETVFEEYYKTMAPAIMHSLPAIGEKRLRAVDKRLGGKDAPEGSAEPAQKQASFQLGSAIEAQHGSSAVQMITIGFADELEEPPALVPSTVVGDTPVYACEVVENRNIQAAGSGMQTRHIEFKLEPGMSYEAGDHLVICPENSEEDAQRVLSLTPDYDLDTVVMWKRNAETRSRFNFPVDTPLTIRNVLCNLVDLHAAPKKQFLANLATIVGEPLHAAELRKIVATQKATVEWLAARAPMTVLDTLDAFPIADTQFGRLLEILPPMRTRPYSIASSPKLQQETVHLCVGLNQTTVAGKEPFFGLCSSFLTTVAAGTGRKVNVFVEEADEHFRVPADDTPALLISAGTGYAPMRSFVQERTARGAKGGTFVFFGCRSEATDYIYADEFAEATEKGHIDGLFVAFSRSQVQPKRYVQQALLDERDLVWRLVEEQGAHLYVCGCGSRVGVGVTNALKEIVKEKSGKDDAYAEAYLEKLQESHRYELDVWG